MELGGEFGEGGVEMGEEGVEAVGIGGWGRPDPGRVLRRRGEGVGDHAVNVRGAKGRVNRFLSDL